MHVSRFPLKFYVDNGRYVVYNQTSYENTNNRIHENIMKGQKICDKCGHGTGPRAYMCPNCNAPFVFSAKSKESKNTKFIKDFNWRELNTGDKIKANGGPYYVKGSDFIPMGYRGKFTVISLDNDGIVGYSEKGGYCHIYMGRDKQCSETKIWKTKHRLIRLKPKTAKAASALT